MEILELPRELVERILSFLVGEVSPLFASHYRLVCKLFAHEIQEQIFKRQPLIAYSEDERNLGEPADRHITLAIENARFARLFEQHGGTIIGHQVLRKPYNDLLPTITYLRNLVEAVLEPDNGLAIEDMRKRYTMEICTALSSVYFKQLRYVLFIRSYTEINAPSLNHDIPSALAATNQLSCFLRKFEDSPDIFSDSWVLPKPLVAASACGHVKMVKEIIRLAGDQANDAADPLPRHGKHESVVTVYRRALFAAMQTRQTKTGKIFFDYFVSRMKVGYPMSHQSRMLLLGTIKYVDSGFIGEICQVMAERGETLTAGDIQMILLVGTCSALRFLLENKYLNPNAMAKTTPLTLAIRNRRYDLARILLQYGAEVNGVPTEGPPVTALCDAATTGYRGRSDNPLPSIRFLLEHGADPVIGYWRNPMQALWPDVEFLLQQAVEHGNEVALRRETWAKYQSAKSGQTETLVIE